MFFKKNPDKVPQTLLITIIFVILTAITLGTYQLQKNADSPQKHAVSAEERMKSMSESGGL